MTWHPLTLRAHTHHVMSAVLNSVRIVAPARTRRSETGAKACGAVRVRASADQDAPDVVTSTNMPRRRLINLAAATTALVVSSNANAGEFGSDAAMAVMRREGSLKLTENEWKDRLKDDPYAFEVLRKEATERPFSSPLNNEKRVGTFVCAGCGVDLFASDAKYDSGTGWPSFFQPINAKVVTEVPDYSIVFLPRTEVRCANCQGHLGHVFEDGPRDKTGLRYCMNGVSMKFTPKEVQR